jgi:ferredoxin-NADP reductase
MSWQVATLCKKEQLATDIIGLTFSLPNWQPHLPGQHYLLRLIGDAHNIRQYSIVSAPSQKNQVEFAIQITPDGRITPQLSRLKLGDQVELQLAPASDFTWQVGYTEPLVLIAGGCGLAPLLSMLRHHIESKQERTVIALISVQSPEYFLYQSELEGYAQKHPSFQLITTYTKTPPKNWSGYARRIDRKILEEALGRVKDQKPRIYVCGSTPFVETVTQNLLVAGFEYENVFAERFGNWNV